jgi:hypothetical protein
MYKIKSLPPQKHKKQVSHENNPEEFSKKNLSDELTI